MMNTIRATAGVGEAANFVIGCALCVPAGIIYKRNHTRKGALIGMLTGTVIMTGSQKASIRSQLRTACRSARWYGYLSLILFLLLRLSVYSCYFSPYKIMIGENIRDFLSE